MEAINLLVELDSISKIHTLKRDDIDALMVEFAKRIIATLKIERMSVWLFNTEHNAVVSIGEYGWPEKRFIKNTILPAEKYPNYFKAISENEILLVENVYLNPATIELAEDYSRPLQLISLMDIPLRIGGELVGVMCFEQCGEKERVFNANQQTFAFSVALVFASTLEARQRRALQHKLNEEINQKELLLKEIHHRVKNNLSVISSLINLQSGKVRDEYHKGLFDEHKSRIDSIALIHKLVFKTKNVTHINIRNYISEIISNLQEAYDTGKTKVDITMDVENTVFDLDYALPLGLIVNELITNSFKHAFVNKNSGAIHIKLSRGNKVKITVSDNGVGFNSLEIKKHSLGMEILTGLVEQIGGIHVFENSNGTLFTMEFTESR